MDIDNLKQSISSYKKKQSSKKRKFSKLEVTPLGVCTEIVSAIIAGLLIGNIIDSYAGTKFLFKVICLVLGCIASFITIYKFTMVKR